MAPTEAATARARHTKNRLAEARKAAGLSQLELSARTGVSRSEISAIETGRLTPSVKHALALARALGVSVEDIFGEGEAGNDLSGGRFPEGTLLWKLKGPRAPRLLPCETTPSGTLAHDAVVAKGRIVERVRGPLPDSLVIAGCDPAVGLLVREVERLGVRAIPLQRGSTSALEEVARGVADAAGVHVAGVHVGPRAGLDGELDNASAARSRLGQGCHLLRIARWKEGIACREAPRRSPTKRWLAGLRWAAREPGSAARLLQDRLLASTGIRRSTRRVAPDHRTLARLVGGGWADAGICVEYAAREAGLEFVPLTEEPYDLCIPDALLEEPPLQALIAAVRSPRYRRLLADLPGYDTRETGELVRVV